MSLYYQKIVILNAKSIESEVKIRKRKDERKGVYIKKRL